jgi:hypothetical protein
MMTTDVIINLYITMEVTLPINDVYVIFLYVVFLKE